MTEMIALPPQNLEAEQFVLSSILLDPDSLLLASDIIDSSDLYSEKHRQLFNACLDIYQSGERIDVVSLAERLKSKNQFEKIGAGYLAMLAGLSPTSANVKFYAKIVKEKALLRKIKLWAKRLSSRADEGIEDIKAFFGEMERDVIQLSQAVRESKSPLTGDILQTIFSEWQESKSGAKKYFPTDYKFNGVIPGFFPKHFWMIGGYTANGKSTLLNQIIIDGCVEGIRPLIFSLEDSREEKMLKLISNLSDVSQMKLILGDIAGHEKEINEATEMIKKWKPIIYDDVYSLEGIRLKSKKHKLQDNINLIAIDYVQNINDSGDLYRDMREASIQLDRMKKDLDVTVIALSQVTNESAKTNSELIGLKGAGELAAAADIVFWLKRVRGEGRERWLDCEIRKNRPFGRTGIIPLMFSENWTQIDKRGF